MTTKVTILDYGMCNLLNVARAFEYIGAEVNITDSVSEAMSADRLVVPGVGAFKDSIIEVQRRGFDDVIRNYVRTERPFLGICVGMQMLFDSSDEFGSHDGLGILAGKVESIPSLTMTGEIQRVPHIGWNHLVKSELGRTWENTLLHDFNGKSPAVYFVHSFSAHPKDTSDRLADCIYGGHQVCAAVQRANLMATQFHPERSGKLGLEILRKFLNF